MYWYMLPYLLQIPQKIILGQIGINPGLVDEGVEADHLLSPIDQVLYLSNGAIDFVWRVITLKNIY